MHPPLIFLDIDDVLVLNEKYNGWAALEALAHDVEHHPELWQQLVFPEGRDNLRALHDEFSPEYVVSSTWATQFTQEQIKDVCSGLICADTSIGGKLHH
jgi:hypothetical protein